MKNLHEKTILRIISDAITFDRIASGMQTVLTAFDTNKGEVFEPELHYYGLENAFDLLGISSEEELIDRIYSQFNTFMSDNVGKSTDLSKLFYVDVLVEIKDYFTNKKQVLEKV